MTQDRRLPEESQGDGPRSFGKIVWPSPGRMPYLRELDGWRGASILLVLAAHMVPLGPVRLGLTLTASAMGMSIFFVLSGFLITSTLMYHPSTRDFLIRRLCRIVPLAWLFLLIVFPVAHAPLKTYLPNLLFFSNLPPFWLIPLTSHLWSLCVECQFYLLAALLFGFLGRKALLALPFLGVCVTIFRIANAVPISVVTWYRIDEIFAGCSLALVYEGVVGRRVRRVLTKVPPGVWLILFAATCHPGAPVANYFRPYLAAAAVGSTALQPWSRWAKHARKPWLAYVAGISYALYVIHHLFIFGWFQPQSKMLRYLRRPVGLACTWALAELSTRFYEKRWIDFGKRLIRKQSAVEAADVAPSLEKAS